MQQTVEIIGEERVQRMLASVGEVGRDTSTITRVWSGIMHDEVEQNFEAEGRPKWKSLYPATIKDRQKKGYWPGKILQRRGDLVRSVVPSSTVEMSRVSTNKVYARIQNFGGVIKRYARSLLRRQKKSQSGKFEKGFEKEGHGATTGAYEIDIPGRQFMKITANGFAKIIKAGEKWIQQHTQKKG